MSYQYKPTSSYHSTVDNGFYLETMTNRPIPALPDDVLYEVLSQYQYRPDLLAYDLYEDVRLWWVFAARNKDIIKDPIYDLYAGQKIRIPQLQTLKFALGF